MLPSPFPQFTPDEARHSLAMASPGVNRWKQVMPRGPSTTIPDDEYKLAARFNLNLPPFDQPPDCKLCKKRGVIAQHPWHLLCCPSNPRRALFEPMMKAMVEYGVSHVGGQLVRPLEPRRQQNSAPQSDTVIRAPVVRAVSASGDEKRSDEKEELSVKAAKRRRPRRRRKAAATTVSATEAPTSLHTAGVPTACLQLN
jgi:hypothetical protein